MRIERGTIEGDFRLEEGLCLRGMVTGDTYVKDGAFLEIYGTCCRDVLIETGAEVVIYGTVVGSVVNRGGKLSICGFVQGDVTTLAGETTVDVEAVIDGRIEDDPQLGDPD